MKSSTKEAIARGEAWFMEQGWKPFKFQRDAWKSYLDGKSGIVTAPTGYGKTYSLCVPAILGSSKKQGLKCIWVTPIRALTREIKIAFTRALSGLDVDWAVGVRTGDTDTAQRKKMQRNPPDVLITTPESLHVILATKGYPSFLSQLETIICDEWHELVGSKRGVLVELALSRIKRLSPNIKLWGISATIGNLDEAASVLFGTGQDELKTVLIKGKVTKRIDVVALAPDNIESFPWAGYFGLRMVPQVLQIVKDSKSTIIFTNTRAMCERWYQKLLEVEPSLAGQIAMHHGSIGRDVRDWVEEALYDGKLKAVVSTSSLDLGVDFRPVENVVQIGSPKGVARCMQRAGRSGHSPGALSTIYFVPTHALELIEAAALRKAINEGLLEARVPYVRSFDVLVQYLVTLAVSDGFDAQEIFGEVRSTFCFASLSELEWQWALDFIVHGGSSLDAYDEFKKVEIEGGRYVVNDRAVALKHRLSIGTIVSNVAMQIKYLSGGRLGTIEENFISRLTPGDVFWFAGRSLEFLRVKDNTAIVKKSTQKTGRIPSWQGSRMQLSSQLSQVLRSKVVEYHFADKTDPELEDLRPLLDLQDKYSAVPRENQFLIERYKSSDGYHLLMFPFEGRFVHEGMAALLGYRIAAEKSMTFTFAMNDYGFELLSDQLIPLDRALENDLFRTVNLESDIQNSVNGIEVAKRKFHEICRVSGLIFQGYPGKHKKSRHLQASTGLMFEVFRQYDEANLLYLQAFEESMYFQLEKDRLQAALERISQQDLLVAQPAKFTPLALPIVADSLRERITSEKLEARIRKMKLDLLAD